MRQIFRFVSTFYKKKMESILKLISLTQPVEVDEDSDAEKLSPLLDPKIKDGFNNNKIPNSALHIEGVDESIDDTDTEIDEHEVVSVELFWNKFFWWVCF